MIKHDLLLQGNAYGQSLFFFSEQTTNFCIAKVNFHVNCIIYINQGYLMIKNSKRMFYADYYLLGQKIE